MAGSNPTCYGNGWKQMGSECWWTRAVRWWTATCAAAAVSVWAHRAVLTPRGENLMDARPCDGCAAMWRMLHPCCALAVNQRAESSGERALVSAHKWCLLWCCSWPRAGGSGASVPFRRLHSLWRSSEYLLEIGYAAWLARRICLLSFSFLPRIDFRFVLSFYLFYPHCCMCLQLKARPKACRTGTEEVTTAHMSPAQQWYQMSLCRLLQAQPGLGSSLAVLLLHRGEGFFYFLCAFSLEAWTRVDDDDFPPHFFFFA